MNTYDRILQDKCIAFSSVTDLFNGETLIPFDELPEDVVRALDSVEVKENVVDGKGGEQVITRTYKYKFLDKGKALERLANHLGMFKG